MPNCSFTVWVRYWNRFCVFFSVDLWDLVLVFVFWFIELSQNSSFFFCLYDLFPGFWDSQFMFFISTAHSLFELIRNRNQLSLCFCLYSLVYQSGSKPSGRYVEYLKVNSEIERGTLLQCVFSGWHDQFHVSGGTQFVFLLIPLFPFWDWQSHDKGMDLILSLVFTHWVYQSGSKPSVHYVENLKLSLEIEGGIYWNVFSLICMINFIWILLIHCLDWWLHDKG